MQESNPTLTAKIWFKALSEGTLQKVKGKSIAGVKKFNNALFLFSATHTNSAWSCMKCHIFKKRDSSGFFAVSLRNDEFLAVNLTEEEARSEFAKQGGNLDYWELVKAGL